MTNTRITTDSELKETGSYSAAGVDTRQEQSALSPLFRSLRDTWSNRGHVRMELGHFANVVELGPISVAISTDGVGSKTIIAQLMLSYGSIGVDCVAMNVNDVVCVGARPETMVDYLAVQTINPKMIEEIGEGLKVGAAEAGITIVGGETAQLPEIIRGEEEGLGFDLAGTCIGTLQLDKIITGARLSAGDVILGLRSSGIHCNGLTLARKVFGITSDTTTDHKKHILSQRIEGLKGTLGEELLQPSRIYVKPVLDLLDHGIDIKGLAHITSDGFLNLPRLEADVGYIFDRLPEPHAIFREIQRKGNVPDQEMYEVFNMGIGFCIIVSEHDAENALAIARRHDPETSPVGYVVEDNDRVVRLIGPRLVGSRDRGFERV